MLNLAAQGVYWTIQGEGYYAGEPMVFIRLAGCSVGCKACDTNYQHSSTATEEEIVGLCDELRATHKRASYVWVTGGEPTDQDLHKLNKLLWNRGFKPCVATSGVRELTDKWWCASISPHTPDFKQRCGYEIKLVPGLNGLDLHTLDLSHCSFGYWWVQPMAGSRDSLEACCEWLKNNSHFRMSPQSHKSWGLP